MIVADKPVNALVASDSLSHRVIGEAMHVHRVLGPGFLESIYQNALLLRLRKIGFLVEAGAQLPVQFEGEIIGNFQTDIVVEHRLLLELKAVSVLTTAHEVQLVNYLTATRIKVGLLFNFGAKSLEIKRRTLGYFTADCSVESEQSSQSFNPIQPHA